MWIHKFAPLLIVAGVIIIGLGAWMFKPEYIIGGVGEILIGVIFIRQSKRLAADAELRGPRSTENSA